MQTKTIGYASWKGGTGKTLLSFNTMERGRAAGLRVLGCDFDEQRMLSRLCALSSRVAPEWPELEVDEGNVDAESIELLEGMQRAGEYDLIVCDLPGADSLLMDRLLSRMDAVLIPVNGAPLELMNTSRMLAKAAAKGWPTYLVPNNMQPHRRRKEEGTETMRQMGANISPVTVVRRVTHWDAGVEGLAATEYAPSSPAAGEIREYWAWLQGAVKIGQTDVRAGAGAHARERRHA